MYLPVNKASRASMTIVKSLGGGYQQTPTKEGAVGPGSYNTAVSDFKDKNVKNNKGYQMAAPISISPRVRAAVSNPAL